MPWFTLAERAESVKIISPRRSGHCSSHPPRRYDSHNLRIRNSSGAEAYEYKDLTNPITGIFRN